MQLLLIPSAQTEAGDLTFIIPLANQWEDFLFLVTGYFINIHDIH